MIESSCLDRLLPSLVSLRHAPISPSQIMPDSQETLLAKKRARRRLIGAVALVLLVVIVLPMVLDKEPKPLQNELSVQIPRQDAGSFKTRVLPQAPSPGKGDEPAVAPTAQGAVNAVVPPATKAASKAPEKPALKDASGSEPVKAADDRASVAVISISEAQRAQAALRDEAWVIPLGTFASAENVKQLQTKLGATGVKSTVDALKTAEGERIRVRAGPFKTRAEAEAARLHQAQVPRIR